jgi:NAD(P)-dependent dehydrogenase (short-subunit alcohol dehydrogenase family)
MEQISGKHAFITGGASGIGLAMAHALHGEGAVITIADYDAERLEQLPQNYHRLILDVRNRDNWALAKADAEAALGPVAILCNNAGIGPNVGELADSDPAQFDRMIAIKLAGTYNGIHTFAADMRGRGEGHIVNTASMAGLEINARLGAYTAAKFAVVGLTEVLRKEMEPHGVGVSVLCPGMVSTGLPVTTAKADGRYDPDAAAPAMPGLDPACVGLRVVEAIKGNWAYILTHGERKAAVEARLSAIISAFDATPHSAQLTVTTRALDGVRPGGA